MSSTRRTTLRRVKDAYYTPAWCVRELLQHQSPNLNGNSIGWWLNALPKRWLEPAVGQGSIIRAVDEYYASWTLPRDRPRWVAHDVQEPTEKINAKLVLGSYLDQPSRPYGCVISNPPFVLADRFIEKALDEGTVVMMLLSINYPSSGADSCYVQFGDQIFNRPDFMRESKPSCFQLPHRPSFTGQGTDSIAYAWFCWGFPRPPVYSMLSTVPSDVRRADNAEVKRLCAHTARKSIKLR